MRRRLSHPGMRQLLKFCLVGGSGVLVNLLAFVLLSKLAPAAPTEVLLPLRPTRYNVRWLHLISLGAFVVANLWNFEINRLWTFGSNGSVSRVRFGHFFTVGLAAQFVGFFILTALTNPKSPIQLPVSIFDGSSGLRTRHYWAQLIMIICTTPLSFILNKLWTFREHRQDRHPDPGETPSETGQSVGTVGPAHSPGGKRAGRHPSSWLSGASNGSGRRRNRPPAGKPPRTGERG